MCFDMMSAELSAACKARDMANKDLKDAYAKIEELKQIIEKQARMNRTTAKMALDLDTVTAERDRWESDYRDLEATMDVVEEQYRLSAQASRTEIAILEADRDRLQKAYDAMARDLKYMSDQLHEARRARNG